MEENKLNSRWSWKINEADLLNQIKNYNTLKITQSYRGISTLIVCVVISINFLLFLFGVFDLYSIFIVFIIYTPIAYFVHKGHRWAIIALIILWTIEKGLIIYGTPEEWFWPLFWWIVLTPYFYKALKVENEKRKIDNIKNDDLNNIYCYDCGTKNDGDAKFCVKCGCKISHSLKNKINN